MDLAYIALTFSFFLSGLSLGLGIKMNKKSRNDGKKSNYNGQEDRPTEEPKLFYVY